MRIDAKTMLDEQLPKLYPEIAVADASEPPAGRVPPANDPPPWEDEELNGEDEAGSDETNGSADNGEEEGEEGERRPAGRPGYARRARKRYDRETFAVEIVVDSLVIVPTRPAKEQVANHLLTMISLGVFMPGDRLPPERWLAQQSAYSLTRAIVQDAYDILERMGVIERVATKGAYVRSAEASRMYFTRQHFLDDIGMAIRGQLSRSQIERAFREALDMMFASRDPIRANSRRALRANTELKAEKKGEGKDEARDTDRQ